MSCDLGETWNSWIIKIQKCRLKLDKSSLLPPFNLLERESFNKTPHHKWPGLLWFNQGSTSCAMLPSRMGEHGVSWVNMENMKYQPDDLNHSIYYSKHSIMTQTLYLWLKTLRLSKRWLKTLYFMAFKATVENMILSQLKMWEHQVKW